jgi:hypothetical protein
MFLRFLFADERVADKIPAFVFDYAFVNTSLYYRVRRGFIPADFFVQYFYYLLRGCISVAPQYIQDFQFRVK